LPRLGIDSIESPVSPTLHVVSDKFVTCEQASNNFHFYSWFSADCKNTTTHLCICCAKCFILKVIRSRSLVFAANFDFQKRFSVFPDGGVFINTQSVPLAAAPSGVCACVCMRNVFLDAQQMQYAMRSRITLFVFTGDAVGNARQQDGVLRWFEVRLSSRSVQMGGREGGEREREREREREGHVPCFK
jgi:hypothetical protein